MRKILIAGQHTTRQSIKRMTKKMEILKSTVFDVLSQKERNLRIDREWTTFGLCAIHTGKDTGSLVISQKAQKQGILISQRHPQDTRGISIKK